MIIEETKLENTDYPAFKEYNVRIKKVEDRRYVVECKYGRIGNAINTNIYPKTGNYTIYEAQDMAATVIKKKIKKGYVKAWKKTTL